MRSCWPHGIYRGRSYWLFNIPVLSGLLRHQDSTWEGGRELSHHLSPLITAHCLSLPHFLGFSQEIEQQKSQRLLDIYGFSPCPLLPWSCCGRNKGKGKTLNDVNFSDLCYKLDSMSYSPRTGQAPWYIYPCLMSLTSYFWDWFSSCYCLVTESGPSLCHPMDCSTPGFPVLHYLQSLLKLMFIKSVMPYAFSESIFKYCLYAYLCVEKFLKLTYWLYLHFLVMK